MRLTNTACSDVFTLMWAPDAPLSSHCRHIVHVFWYPCAAEQSRAAVHSSMVNIRAARCPNPDCDNMKLSRGSKACKSVLMKGSRVGNARHPKKNSQTVTRVASDLEGNNRKQGPVNKLVQSAFNKVCAKAIVFAD